MELLITKNVPWINDNRNWRIESLLIQEQRNLHEVKVHCFALQMRSHSCTIHHTTTQPQKHTLSSSVKSCLAFLFSSRNAVDGIHCVLRILSDGSFSEVYVECGVICL